MLRTTGKSFSAGAFRVNGRPCTADQNALIALHKLRTQMGSPAEMEASKAWL